MVPFMSSASNLLSATASTALAALAALALAQRRAATASLAARPAAVVTALNIYPVKGLRAVALAEAELTPTGLAGDRQWLIVDLDEAEGVGRFVSQREAPALATLQPAILSGGGAEAGAAAGAAAPSAVGRCHTVLRVAAW